MKELINKKFFFARHGKTEWNEKQLCQGQLDVELNEAGRLEARLFGETIKGLSFSRICVSPLKRALETAKIIQGTMSSCKIQLIDELKERNWGQLEGISSLQMYHIEEMEEKDPDYQPGKGVESRDVFKSRILRGINIALELDDVPLIISHGRVFLSLCDILNVPLLRQVPNTTLIECSPGNIGWQVSYKKD
jgi:broad specificity phosphatase PhoE